MSSTFFALMDSRSMIMRTVKKVELLQKHSLKDDEPEPNDLQAIGST